MLTDSSVDMSATLLLEVRPAIERHPSYVYIRPRSITILSKVFKPSHSQHSGHKNVILGTHFYVKIWHLHVCPGVAPLECTWYRMHDVIIE